MIDRNGIAVGRRRDRTVRPSTFTPGVSGAAPAPKDAPASPLETIGTGDKPVRWGFLALGVTVVALGLAVLPGRTAIAPLVESDYCYMLTAVDRLYDDLGLTATQPVAPMQAWEWRYDWGFLTQWPIGYPLLICGLRFVFGLTSIQACQWIGVVACALAVVGWFEWIRRSVPGGVTGLLLAAAAAGCSAPLACLMNPSTDILLIALLPFVLLFTLRGIRRSGLDGREESCTRPMAWLVVSGLSAGALFWFRYAGAFVPAGIILYLFLERSQRRAARFRRIAVFAVCAALPIGAILAVNRIFSPTGSVQLQLNLGATAGFDFSVGRLAQAWWSFTDLGFYDYRWFSHWVFALGPIALAGVALCGRSVRRALASFLSSPAWGLSACLVVALLVLLVGATTVFGGKYDYVADGRYYLPIRPLYFLLVAGPLMLVPRRVVRVVMCVGLLTACSWIVQVDWQRPYHRRLAAKGAVTPYGQWSRCFEPGASELYDWLRARAGPDLIVISNFHEYIALETKIPALPIPKDRPTLSRWIDHICTARGVTDPRVLFVLDPDNKWRNYWIPDPDEVTATFALTRCDRAPETISAGVFDYDRAGAGLSASNIVKGEFITSRIQYGDGLAAGAVKGAGVDDAFAAHSFVTGQVGVAVKEVFDVEISDRPLERIFVAVKNGEPLAADPHDR